ncbi:sensor histidine kinase [Nocardioides renjunii]|uniref:sensor histidine kinase n=1 Tax=Nocardioides renjunii TaxID=3095075 RepID=UPI002AFE6122|nr:sensor domain-containing protein [Nocardioides sp. S-34]WQQ23540.1 sensor domain-containing protein [Nocardioides sp. S-34]
MATTARVRPALRRTLRSLEQLLGGFGTALLALGLLVWAVTLGWFTAATTLGLVHGLADRERARLGRWGVEVAAPAVRPVRLGEALRDPATRSELAWLARHAVAGNVVGFLAVLAPFSAARDLTFPLWWWTLPDGWASPSLGFWVVREWSGVPGVVLLGACWASATVLLAPVAARRQLRVARRLLGQDPGDLTMRVAELTRTRAAALDAHAAELRRIERSLHDGAQNRIVATTVLIGAARRSLATTGPAATDQLLGQAQDAAELALAELRAVVRTILPPVLADRGLAGALQGLAAASPVPCTTTVDVPVRSAASVEATIYFVVAEALTNVARHSGAERAHVDVRLRAADDGSEVVEAVVRDDGAGGAREGVGTGLSGIRHRVEAMDGRWSLTSPPGGPTELRVVVPCGS